MTPQTIAAELKRLSRLKFDRWNESDIREDFVAKLLALLGYRKDTDYDINREGSHLLSRAFLYVGRQRVDIDYALLVRKRRFWIIEAKGPNPRTIGEEAIFQAHFYALHPEVAARYFAVTNGWETRIYDLRALGDDYQPVEQFSIQELPTRFAALNRLLGASQIRTVLRDRIVSDLRDVLQAEIRDETVDELAHRIDATIDEARFIVRENRRAVIQGKYDDEARVVAEVYADASPEQIVRVAFERPNSNKDFELARGVFDDALRSLDDLRQAQLFAYVCRLLEGRPQARLRRNWVRLLLHYRARHEHAVFEQTGRSMTEAARRSISLVLTDFAEEPALRHLARFEDGLHRICYKLTFTSDAREQFKNMAARAATLLQEEDIVYSQPSSAAERVRTVERIVGHVYRLAAKEDEAALLKLVTNLEGMEPSFENEFQTNYAQRSEDERDLSFLAAYGKTFDVGRSAMCEVLCTYFDEADLLDEAAVSALEGLVRSPSNSVNYAEELLLRVYSARGLITVSPSAEEAFREASAAGAVHFIPARDGSRGLHVDIKRADGSHVRLSGHSSLEPPGIHLTTLGMP